MVATNHHSTGQWSRRRKRGRKTLKNLELGTLRNLIAGIIGEGLGSQILGSVLDMSSTGDLDTGSIVTQIAGGGVGGGVLMAVVGVVKNMMKK